MEFTEKHDLPSGGWVELKNPNWLRTKDRNALVRKIQEGKTDSDVDRGITSIRQMIAMLVVSWSLPYQPDPVDNGDGTTTARPWVLPSTDPAIVDELLVTDGNALEKLLEPASRVLNPKAPSPDDTEDLESPSGPGNA
jgi:hypothetical protein